VRPRANFFGATLTARLFVHHAILSELELSFWERMAGTTRLELATSAVTGQRSNQLNYVPTDWVNRHMVGTEGFEPSTFRV
jgi:hypothetical protein